MEELVINGQTYEFKFGIGFLRDMNKMIAVPVKEVPGMKKDVGSIIMRQRCSVVTWKHL